MKNPYRYTPAAYMTAGVKKHLVKAGFSEEIRNALKRFDAGDHGEYSEKPDNPNIERFGSYELSFGRVWIIDYAFFPDRDFITILLPREYDK